MNSAESSGSVVAKERTPGPLGIWKDPQNLKDKRAGGGKALGCSRWREQMRGGVASVATGTGCAHAGGAAANPQHPSSERGAEHAEQGVGMSSGAPRLTR